jgi:uncharacterized phage-associated protein
MRSDHVLCYIRTMASAHDVAKYILREQGPMDTWKLQKLVYYTQAWHLVWDGEPLFPEKIEAWANGPVIPDLYQRHRGLYTVSEWPGGKISNLTTSERASIDAVLKHYGRHTGYWLRERTHLEPPWRNARQGVPAGARSNAPITVDALGEYYGSL